MTIMDQQDEQTQHQPLERHRRARSGRGGAAMIKVTVERQVRPNDDSDLTGCWELTDDGLLLVVQADMVTEGGAEMLTEAIEGILKRLPVRHLRDMTDAPARGRRGARQPLRIVGPGAVA